MRVNFSPARALNLIKNDDLSPLPKNQKTLLYFFAPWCKVCRLMGPTIESLVNEWENRLPIFGINIDENPKTQVKYHIASIPTLLLLDENGEEIMRQVGLSKLPPPILMEAMEKKVHA